MTNFLIGFGLGLLLGLLVGVTFTEWLMSDGLRALGGHP